MRKTLYLILLCQSALLANAQRDTAAVKTDTSQNPSLPAYASYKVKGKVISGVAGIYGTKQEGTKTASGDPFSNDELTAACNEFPLNTLVKVTNTRNDQTVIVRINDHVGVSDSKKGIIIELSRAAAGSLQFNKKFSLKIKLQQVIVTTLLSIKKQKSDTIVIAIDSTVKKDTTSPNTFRKTGKMITGIASFYSANLDGTKTATGETYRNSRLTAASNNLKLNTWVLVTNLKNKKEVIVRINDRMHPRMKKKGRVVDLSGSAAEMLDFKENGLTKVKVETIEFVHIEPSKPDSLLLPKQDSALVADSLRLDSAITAEKTREAKTRTGIASFYSKNLDGTKTSTGEIYRNNKLTAASNDFELNTWVRVTNLKNNKYVILRINDHMHPRMQKKGRVVDLSRAAAKKLDFIKDGLTRVKVEIVSKDTLE